MTGANLMEERKILVWDLPTRVFHWLLALSFAGAYLTAESERLRDVHVVLGYGMFGLIGFRVLWGLVGTRYARFASFAFGPGRVLSYVGSLAAMRPQHYVGHNPAGGWAIFALLGLGLVAAASGLAAFNEVGGEWMEGLHEGASNTMLALVVVHVAAVLLSSVLHQENLVHSMITGFKQGEPVEGIRKRRVLVGAALLVAVLGFWGATLTGNAPDLPGIGSLAQANVERGDHRGRD